MNDTLSARRSRATFVWDLPVCVPNTHGSCPGVALTALKLRWPQYHQARMNISRLKPCRSAPTKIQCHTGGRRSGHEGRGQASDTSPFTLLPERQGKAKERKERVFFKRIFPPILHGKLEK